MMSSILVVDDRDANCQYLAALLGGKGFHVLQASDGAEALQMVCAERPALVIADILMPTMDGYEFVRQLRRQPEVAQTPVVFVSGQFPQGEAATLARRCGVSEFVLKPAEPEAILQAVERALSSTAEQRTPQEPSPPLEHFEELHRQLLTGTLARKAEELETTNRRLSGLVTLCRQLASEHDTSRLLPLFCAAAADIMAARYVVVALRDVFGEEIRHIMANGKDDSVVAAISAASTVGCLLRLVRPDRPLLLECDDPNTEESLQPPLRELAPVLIAPVASVSGAYGVLCLAGLAAGRRPNGSEKEMAATLAGQLAIAYENAARYGQMQRHAEELQLEVRERERAQEESRRLNQELEARVAERTQALEESHRQLRLSERMASMGTLCAGLGHDMGNLLLPIRTRLDASDGADPPPQIARHLGPVRQCVEYLQSLTKGLRMLALESNGTETDAATDLESWLEEINPLLKSILTRGITFQCRIEKGLPPVRISRHRLSQAVFNVVSNAVDALRSGGGGSVTLNAHSPTGNGLVLLRISDDGPGMTEEVRSRILDPFFTTKRRAFSTGLGMSLVHGVIKSAGGSIEIESTPGSGTVITLILPAAVEKGETDVTAGRAKPIAAVTLHDERRQALARSLLQSMGYETLVGKPPDLANARIWLTDAEAGLLEMARDFLRSDPERRVAVSGAVDEQWQQLGVLELGDSFQLSHIRFQLRDLLAKPPVGETAL